MTQIPFLLAAEGLNKSFAGFHAIRDLSFYLDEGELRTVIGPNGAGKTTFLDLITGRTRPDTGTLEFSGNHNLLNLTEYEIYRLGIGRPGAVVREGFSVQSSEFRFPISPARLTL